MKRNIIICALSALMSVGAAMTADAQTLQLQSSKNEVTESEAGTYDRVEYVRQTVAGETVLASFPATLDGYYFGPNAKRYVVSEVTEHADGTMDITASDMADGDDFVAGQKYLITPTQNLSTIVILTPAQKTTVPATTTPLVFQTVESGIVTQIENLNIVNNNSNDKVYDISGKLQNSTKQSGIYVVKNKKVIVK